MGIKETEYTLTCPISKFKIDFKAGCVDDAIQICTSCLFSDTDQDDMRLDKICRCPDGMNDIDFNILKKEFYSTGKKLTKESFYEFMRDYYIH